MSETASLNEKKLHFKTQNEGGEGFGSALGGPLQDDNDSSGNQEVGPVAENFKPPLINAAATFFNEESDQSATVKGKQSDETIENLVALFRDFLEAAPTPAASSHTRTQRNTAGRKRLFGLHKGLSPQTGSNNRYDYEQKYPRDRPGEEAADNARVWLTYLDEAEAFDRERVEGWKETVDVLLVFAGLFSGVITTFISQASQSLQQDDSQVSASLLFEIAQILRAQSSGTPINDIPKSTLTPTSPFTPSTNAFLVNGLWFTSLAIALSTALFAVLAKQWLYYYISSITGTAHEKARARQLRFKGFELWKVGAIVDLLPILLHLALGLFLLGIIILLFPLDIRVAWTIVVITGITYFLYFISVILPIRYPECPYTTSLTIYVGVLVFSLRNIIRWISKNFKGGFQAVWRRINFKAQCTIRHLIQYTQGLFRHAFNFISTLVGFIRCGFRKLRDTIFTEELPKFTNWREENIKKAVKNAAFLDFEVLHWLYATSPNRSVHRIIARCVAVHPIISQQFERDILDDLWRALEDSETNVVDLRYGLCLDLLAHKRKHWHLLRSSFDVEESQLEEEEYQSYSRIAENVIYHKNVQILKYAIKDDLKLPLVMWRFFFEAGFQDATVAAHILASGQRDLFKWESTCNTGVVSLDNEELGWWKFEYLFHYFFGHASPYVYYTIDKTFETRYLLLITIYRNLSTSWQRPLISDKEQRQNFLLNLFDNIWGRPCSPDEHVSPKQYLSFFRDVCCADAFWSESMTDRARMLAVQCLSRIWDSMDTDVARRFPFTEYHDCDLTPIYQWYSRDLDPYLSGSRGTSPILALLFMPQNCDSLCTILWNDSDAISHFLTCLRNLGHCSLYTTEKYLLQSLTNLFMSVVPNGPLFTVLYNLNSSVLVELWKYLSFRDLNKKIFLSILKSKLDPQKLHDLHGIMIAAAQSEQDIDHRSVLETSAHEFRQSISIAHSQLQLSVENQSTEKRNHSSEGRAQKPNENEHENTDSIVHWMKKIFQS